MPYRKRYGAKKSRKGGKRKTYKRARARSSNARFWGNSQPFPLANKFKTVMRYVEKNISINTTAGIAGELVFSANGLFDPNTAVGGHQPIGFDQISPLYDHYTVLGAKIRATFATSDTSTPIHVGVYLSDVTTTNPDIGNVIENGTCKYLTLGGTQGSDNIKTVVHQVGIGKFLGRKRGIMADSTLKGSASANPTEGVYFHCIVEGMPSGTDPAPIYLTVQIDYIAVFHEPKKLASS